MGLAQRDWMWAACVGVAAIALCAPFASFVPWIGDEGILLRGAQEILRGRTLYRDVFEFYPPGGFFLTAAWLWLFGVSLGSIRALTTLLAAVVAVLTYLCCRRVSRNAPLSAALAVIWVVVSQGLSIHLNHHTMTTMLSMGAFLAATSERRSTAFLAGLLTGGAGMVTQTRGALTAIAAVLSLAPRRWPPFLIGCAIAPLACVAYLAWEGVLLDAWADVIEWPASHYAGVQALPFGAYMSERTWLAVAVFPLASCLAGWIALRASKVRASVAFRSACAFTAAGVFGAFPRPDASLHLAVNMPLALPMLALGMTHIASAWTAFWRRAAFAGVLSSQAPGLVWIILPALALTSAPRADPPTGGAVFAEKHVGEMVQAVVALPPGQKVFFYPYMPLVPVITNREQVSKYDVFVPGYTTAEQYAEACRAVIHEAAWVVYDTRWTATDTLKKIFPAMTNPQPAEKRSFEQMLRVNFSPAWKSERFEILKRRAAAGSKACASVAE